MLWVTAALAGFYHPRDVAAESGMYGSVAQVAATRASDAQQRARSLALALQDYEEALDLLGPAASEAERARLHALTRQYNRELAVLQAAVDRLVGGFDAAFVASMERALAKHPGAVRCERDVATGPSIPGLGARTQRNPACQGDDLNSAIAAVMDADPRLAADLDVLDAALPGFTLEPVPTSIVADRWIGVAPFFQAAAGKALKGIRRADEEARLPIEAAIEQGASREELEALKPRAEAIDADTARRRAELGVPVLARADAVLAKKAPGVGWCAQPATLGGCTGTDATAELAAVLRADKKLQKALP
ncbi:MAG: hypothetical protein H6734_20160 [Alphaproteobacteria bacterium]|nr:hypothetical protein [Alphaproteobacteria bacterium]